MDVYWCLKLCLKHCCLLWSSVFRSLAHLPPGCDNINHIPLFCPSYFLFVFFSSTSFALVLSSLFPVRPSVSGCALTAIKRLPFMRNRSKDKDKAKAIYRRSMCKTPVSRHASPPSSPLPLVITIGQTKEQSLISERGYSVGCNTCQKKF